MNLEGKTAATRRIKCYAIELSVPDPQIGYDEDGDLQIRMDERILMSPAIGHGPEAAIQSAIGDEDERVESIRRVKSAGLLRAMLCPNDENYDLHRGEMEEYVEEMVPDE